MDNYNDNLQRQWTDVNTSTALYIPEAENTSDENVSQKPHKSNKIISPIITFQLVICILILILIFISKPFLPDLNKRVMDFYNAEISASMIFSGDFRDLDYSTFFGATNDEV